MKKKVGILGGGLTGLTIASNLKCDYEILEKENECGGLCRSFQEKNFTFDIGGAHILYSKNKRILNYAKRLLDNNLILNKRNNKIYYKGIFIKYPYENGLGDLPPQDKFEALYYYLNSQNLKKPRNFYEWIYYTFGKGIAKQYLIPYNQKIWKFPLKKISLYWVERVPKPPSEDIIKSALGISTEGYLHQLYFYYPQKGGIQSLITVLKKKSKNIITNFNISKIIKNQNKWIVIDENDIKKEYDKLVSTIPLFDLISYLDNVPKRVKQAVNNLKFNSLITVMIGVKKENLMSYTAVYFPQPEYIFHRVAFPKNFSRYNAPVGQSSLMVEITTKYNSAIWKMSEREIIQKVINDLKKANILEKETQITFQKVCRIKYAYVIYDLNYLDNIKIIRQYFNKIRIALCGRFGEFEYLNMDQCIERGIKTADKINNNL